MTQTAYRVPARHIEELRDRLRALDAKPPHEEQVLRRWLQARALASGRRRPEHFLPLALREALPALADELAALACLHSRHPAADGSERLLVALHDGRTVESVLLPRGGLCVSTQVGCAVACGFCMTGREGLTRQLGSAEIAAQLALARTLRPVKKVVFMGMGEPAHNLDNVLEAIDAMGTHGGIGHKDLVFSTVGDRRVFERLPQGRVKPALALSLHSLDARRRAELLPKAPAFEPAELLEQGLAYARATGYPLQVQWTLLEGVNDGEDELQALEARLARRYAILNMIPWNRVEPLPYRRPSEERVTAIFRRLNQRGVLTRMRQSAGQDVEAGCGQLRSRAQAVVVLRQGAQA
ncbi:MAG: RNA methyltransferase [Piscinibacter sp.]|uniref:RNA methyltransferase n=1 Tax=Piscinibacter sp. TaxID=1903157 RepID=UPI002587DC05|nr:RNA methyltransferase [Piscinibacter sp.]MCW5666140.1 RNA methyltransferase [Piscinibacter sp.]